MKPVTEIPAYAVIVRAIHERGAAQREAFAELARRGLWLTDEQKRQAGFSPGRIAYEADVRARPAYDDGSPRKAWSELDELCRWSWERNPTPRFGAANAEGPSDG